ncbi:hypothetical protein HYH03_009796 [Edaphochlamys debaryana]|uniref:DUF4378 domain-containing protein n=1 Tax=Edaphochlamys debaryana TaxID=47281 RepID=A0A835Y3F1_9CHLO|nr:hypothetical protein HYH03_009796 [Edaphochlamys debaryana]|eukprot:KAG2491840.1 hypothetical protein HYH03_009796 [Edaphochlamys debaryana]
MPAAPAVPAFSRRVAERSWGGDLSSEESFETAPPRRRPQPINAELVKLVASFAPLELAQLKAMEQKARLKKARANALPADSSPLSGGDGESSGGGVTGPDTAMGTATGTETATDPGVHSDPMQEDVPADPAAPMDYSEDPAGAYGAEEAGPYAEMPASAPPPMPPARPASSAPAAPSRHEAPAPRKRSSGGGAAGPRASAAPPKGAVIKRDLNLLPNPVLKTRAETMQRQVAAAQFAHRLHEQHEAARAERERRQQAEQQSMAAQMAADAEAARAAAAHVSHVSNPRPVPIKKKAPAPTAGSASGLHGIQALAAEAAERKPVDPRPWRQNMRRHSTPLGGDAPVGVPPDVGPRAATDAPPPRNVSPGAAAARMRTLDPVARVQLKEFMERKAKEIAARQQAEKQAALDAKTAQLKASKAEMTKARERAHKYAETSKDAPRAPRPAWMDVVPGESTATIGFQRPALARRPPQEQPDFDLVSERSLPHHMSDAMRMEVAERRRQERMHGGGSPTNSRGGRSVLVDDYGHPIDGDEDEFGPQVVRVRDPDHGIPGGGRLYKPGQIRPRPRSASQAGRPTSSNPSARPSQAGNPLPPNRLQVLEMEARMAARKQYEQQLRELQALERRDISRGRDTSRGRDNSRGRSPTAGRKHHSVTRHSRSRSPHKRAKQRTRRSRSGSQGASTQRRAELVSELVAAEQAEQMQARNERQVGDLWDLALQLSARLGALQQGGVPPVQQAWPELPADPQQQQQMLLLQQAQLQQQLAQQQAAAAQQQLAQQQFAQQQQMLAQQQAYEQQLMHQQPAHSAPASMGGAMFGYPPVAVPTGLPMDATLTGMQESPPRDMQFDEGQQVAIDFRSGSDADALPKRARTTPAGSGGGASSRGGATEPASYAVTTALQASLPDAESLQDQSVAGVNVAVGGSIGSAETAGLAPPSLGTMMERVFDVQPTSSVGLQAGSRAPSSAGGDFPGNVGVQASLYTVSVSGRESRRTSGGSGTSIQSRDQDVRPERKGSAPSTSSLQDDESTRQRPFRSTIPVANPPPQPSPSRQVPAAPIIQIPMPPASEQDTVTSGVEPSPGLPYDNAAFSAESADEGASSSSSESAYGERVLTIAELHNMLDDNPVLAQRIELERERERWEEAQQMQEQAEAGHTLRPLAQLLPGGGVDIRPREPVVIVDYSSSSAPSSAPDTPARACETVVTEFEKVNSPIRIRPAQRELLKVQAAKRHEEALEEAIRANVAAQDLATRVEVEEEDPADIPIPKSDDPMSIINLIAHKGRAPARPTIIQLTVPPLQADSATQTHPGVVVAGRDVTVALPGVPASEVLMVPGAKGPELVFMRDLVQPHRQTSPHRPILVKAVKDVGVGTGRPAPSVPQPDFSAAQHMHDSFPPYVLLPSAHPPAAFLSASIGTGAEDYLKEAALRQATLEQAALERAALEQATLDQATLDAERSALEQTLVEQAVRERQASQGSAARREFNLEPLEPIPPLEVPSLRDHVELMEETRPEVQQSRGQVLMDQLARLEELRAAAAAGGARAPASSLRASLGGAAAGLSGGGATGVMGSPPPRPRMVTFVDEPQGPVERVRLAPHELYRQMQDTLKTYEELDAAETELQQLQNARAVAAVQREAHRIAQRLDQTAAAEAQLQMLAQSQADVDAKLQSMEASIRAELRRESTDRVDRERERLDAERERLEAERERERERERDRTDRTLADVANNLSEMATMFVAQLTRNKYAHATVQTTDEVMRDVSPGRSPPSRRTEREIGVQVDAPAAMQPASILRSRSSSPTPPQTSLRPASAPQVPTLTTISASPTKSSLRAPSPQQPAPPQTSLRAGSPTLPAQLPQTSLRQEPVDLLPPRPPSRAGSPGPGPLDLTGVRRQPTASSAGLSVYSEHFEEEEEDTPRVDGPARPGSRKSMRQASRLSSRMSRPESVYEEEFEDYEEDEEAEEVDEDEDLRSRRSRATTRQPSFTASVAESLATAAYSERPSGLRGQASGYSVPESVYEDDFEEDAASRRQPLRSALRQQQSTASIAESIMSEDRRPSSSGRRRSGISAVESVPYTSAGISGESGSYSSVVESIPAVQSSVRFASQRPSSASGARRRRSTAADTIASEPGYTEDFDEGVEEEDEIGEELSGRRRTGTGTVGASSSYAEEVFESGSSPSLHPTRSSLRQPGRHSSSRSTEVEEEELRSDEPQSYSQEVEDESGARTSGSSVRFRQPLATPPKPALVSREKERKARHQEPGGVMSTPTASRATASLVPASSPLDLRAPLEGGLELDDEMMAAYAADAENRMRLEVGVLSDRLNALNAAASAKMKQLDDELMVETQPQRRHALIRTQRLVQVQHDADAADINRQISAVKADYARQQLMLERLYRLAQITSPGVPFGGLAGAGTTPLRPLAGAERVPSPAPAIKSPVKRPATAPAATRGKAPVQTSSSSVLEEQPTGSGSIAEEPSRDRSSMSARIAEEISRLKSASTSIVEEASRYKSTSGSVPDSSRQPATTPGGSIVEEASRYKSTSGSVPESSRPQPSTSAGSISEDASRRPKSTTQSIGEESSRRRSMTQSIAEESSRRRTSGSGSIAEEESLQGDRTGEVRTTGSIASEYSEDYEPPSGAVSRHKLTSRKPSKPGRQTSSVMDDIEESLSQRRTGTGTSGGRSASGVTEEPSGPVATRKRGARRETGSSEDLQGGNSELSVQSADLERQQAELQRMLRKKEKELKDKERRAKLAAKQAAVEKLQAQLAALEKREAKVAAAPAPKPSKKAPAAKPTRGRSSSEIASEPSIQASSAQQAASGSVADEAESAVPESEVPESEVPESEAPESLPEETARTSTIASEGSIRSESRGLRSRSTAGRRRPASGSGSVTESVAYSGAGEGRASEEASYSEESRTAAESGSRVRSSGAPSVTSSEERAAQRVSALHKAVKAKEKELKRLQRKAEEDALQQRLKDLEAAEKALKSQPAAKPPKAPAAAAAPAPSQRKPAAPASGPSTAYSESFDRSASGTIYTAPPGGQSSSSMPEEMASGSKGDSGAIRPFSASGTGSIPDERSSGSLRPAARGPQPVSRSSSIAEEGSQTGLGVSRSSVPPAAQPSDVYSEESFEEGSTHYGASAVREDSEIADELPSEATSAEAGGVTALEPIDEEEAGARSGSVRSRGHSTVGRTASSAEDEDVQEVDFGSEDEDLPGMGPTASRSVVDEVEDLEAEEEEEDLEPQEEAGVEEEEEEKTEEEEEERIAVQEASSEAYDEEYESYQEPVVAVSAEPSPEPSAQYSPEASASVGDEVEDAAARMALAAEGSSASIEHFDAPVASPSASPTASIRSARSSSAKSASIARSASAKSASVKSASIRSASIHSARLSAEPSEELPMPAAVRPAQPGGFNLRDLTATGESGPSHAPSVDSGEFGGVQAPSAPSSRAQAPSVEEFLTEPGSSRGSAAPSIHSDDLGVTAIAAEPSAAAPEPSTLYSEEEPFAVQQRSLSGSEVEETASVSGGRALAEEPSVSSALSAAPSRRSGASALAPQPSDSAAGEEEEEVRELELEYSEDLAQPSSIKAASEAEVQELEVEYTDDLAQPSSVKAASDEEEEDEPVILHSRLSSDEEDEELMVVHEHSGSASEEEAEEELMVVHEHSGSASEEEAEEEPFVAQERSRSASEEEAEVQELEVEYTDDLAQPSSVKAASEEPSEEPLAVREHSRSAATEEASEEPFAVQEHAHSASEQGSIEVEDVEELAGPASITAATDEASEEPFIVHEHSRSASEQGSIEVDDMEELAGPASITAATEEASEEPFVVQQRSRSASPEASYEVEYEEEAGNAASITAATEEAEEEPLVVQEHSRSVTQEASEEPFVVQEHSRSASEQRSIEVEDVEELAGPVSITAATEEASEEPFVVQEHTRSGSEAPEEEASEEPFVVQQRSRSASPEASYEVEYEEEAGNAASVTAATEEAEEEPLVVQEHAGSSAAGSVAGSVAAEEEPEVTAATSLAPAEELSEEPFIIQEHRGTSESEGAEVEEDQYEEDLEVDYEVDAAEETIVEATGLGDEYTEDFGSAAEVVHEASEVGSSRPPAQQASTVSTATYDEDFEETEASGALPAGGTTLDRTTLSVVEEEAEGSPRPDATASNLYSETFPSAGAHTADSDAALAAAPAAERSAGSAAYAPSEEPSEVEEVEVEELEVADVEYSGEEPEPDEELHFGTTSGTPVGPVLAAASAPIGLEVSQRYGPAAGSSGSGAYSEDFGEGDVVEEAEVEAVEAGEEELEAPAPAAAEPSEAAPTPAAAQPESEGSAFSVEDSLKSGTVSSETSANEPLAAAVPPPPAEEASQLAKEPSTAAAAPSAQGEEEEEELEVAEVVEEYSDEFAAAPGDLEAEGSEASAARALPPAADAATIVSHPISQPPSPPVGSDDEGAGEAESPERAEPAGLSGEEEEEVEEVVEEEEIEEAGEEDLDLSDLGLEAVPPPPPPPPLQPAGSDSEAEDEGEARTGAGAGPSEPGAARSTLGGEASSSTLPGPEMEESGLIVVPGASGRSIRQTRQIESKIWRDRESLLGLDDDEEPIEGDLDLLDMSMTAGEGAGGLLEMLGVDVIEESSSMTPSQSFRIRTAGDPLASASSGGSPFTPTLRSSLSHRLATLQEQREGEETEASSEALSPPRPRRLTEVDEMEEQPSDIGESPRREVPDAAGEEEEEEAFEVEDVEEVVELEAGGEEEDEEGPFKQPVQHELPPKHEEEEEEHEAPTAAAAPPAATRESSEHPCEPHHMEAPGAGSEAGSHEPDHDLYASAMAAVASDDLEEYAAAFESAAIDEEDEEEALAAMSHASGSDLAELRVHVEAESEEEEAAAPPAAEASQRSGPEAEPSELEEASESPEASVIEDEELEDVEEEPETARVNPFSVDESIDRMPALTPVGSTPPPVPLHTLLSREPPSESPAEQAPEAGAAAEAEEEGQPHSAAGAVEPTSPTVSSPRSERSGIKEETSLGPLPRSGLGADSESDDGQGLEYRALYARPAEEPATPVAPEAEPAAAAPAAPEPEEDSSGGLRRSGLLEQLRAIAGSDDEQEERAVSPSGRPSVSGLQPAFQALLDQPDDTDVPKGDFESEIEEMLAASRSKSRLQSPYHSRDWGADSETATPEGVTPYSLSARASLAGSPFQPAVPSPPDSAGGAEEVEEEVEQAAEEEPSRDQIVDEITESTMKGLMADALNTMVGPGAPPSISTAPAQLTSPRGASSPRGPVQLLTQPRHRLAHATSAEEAQIEAAAATKPPAEEPVAEEPEEEEEEEYEDDLEAPSDSGGSGKEPAAERSGGSGAEGEASISMSAGDLEGDIELEEEVVEEEPQASMDLPSPLPSDSDSIGSPRRPTYEPPGASKLSAASVPGGALVPERSDRDLAKQTSDEGAGGVGLTSDEDLGWGGVEEETDLDDSWQPDVSGLIAPEMDQAAIERENAPAVSTAPEAVAGYVEQVLEQFMEGRPEFILPGTEPLSLEGFLAQERRLVDASEAQHIHNKMVYDAVNEALLGIYRAANRVQLAQPWLAKSRVVKPLPSPAEMAAQVQKQIKAWSAMRMRDPAEIDKVLAADAQEDEKAWADTAVEEAEVLRETAEAIWADLIADTAAVVAGLEEALSGPSSSAGGAGPGAPPMRRRLAPV